MAVVDDATAVVNVATGVDPPDARVDDKMTGPGAVLRVNSVEFGERVLASREVDVDEGVREVGVVLKEVMFSSPGATLASATAGTFWGWRQVESAQSTKWLMWTESGREEANLEGSLGRAKKGW